MKILPNTSARQLNNLWLKKFKTEEEIHIRFSGAYFFSLKSKYSNFENELWRKRSDPHVDIKFTAVGETSDKPPFIT